MRACAPSTTSSTRETDDASTQDSRHRRWPSSRWSLFALLPPAHRDAPRRRRHRSVRGAFHIHSNRSDGSGTVDAIAAAAARAGLQFIILTDHGDGTRSPDAPAYRSGVLTIDGVELNTTGGHYAAIGLPASPYPLAGTPADVIEDVHRLGGFGIRGASGIAAAVAELAGLGRRRSTASSGSTPTASGATSRALPIARALLTYLLRAPQSMATLLDRPDERAAAMGRAHGDAARRRSRRHRCACASRASASAPIRTRRPSMCGCRATKSSFRTFSNHVVLDGAAVGRCRRRCRAALIDAIRSGPRLHRDRRAGDAGQLDVHGDQRRPDGADGREPRDRRRRVAARIGERAAGHDARAVARWPARARSHRRPARDQRRQGPRRLSHRGLHRECARAARPCRGSSRIQSMSGSRSGRRSPAPVAGAALAGSRRAPARRPPRSGPNDTSVVEIDRRDRSAGTHFAGDPAITWKFALSPGTPAGQFAAVRRSGVGRTGGVRSCAVPRLGVRADARVGAAARAGRQHRAVGKDVLRRRRATHRRCRVRDVRRRSA